MKVVNNAYFKSDSPLVVALGCFDGVHKGHAQVLLSAKKKALELGLPLCIFCFAEPPKNYFSPMSVPLLTTREDKLEIFKSFGADIAVCITLDREFLSVSAEDFVNNILIDSLKASFVVCGFNYTFGKGGAGDPQLIGDICKKKNVGVLVVDERVEDGMSVSSSAIRKFISEGDMHRAADLLGRPYSLSGVVVDGQHLARRLGFPTVNITPLTYVAIPRFGVYVTSVTFDGKKKYGITNVGVRPTVDTRTLCAETHIFDFDGNLYGETVRIEFLHFLRPERRFSGVEQLSEQITMDIEDAREYLNRTFL